MEDRLIAILRRPDVLVAVLSRHLGSRGSADAPYVEMRVALSRINPCLCPWRDKDLNAWRALGNVPRPSKRATLAIIRAIIGSVTDPELSTDELPPLPPNTLPRNLRPHLCAFEHEESLLSPLQKDLQEISQRSGFPNWHWRDRSALAALPSKFRTSFLWSLHLGSWEDVGGVLASYHALALEDNHGLRAILSRFLSLAGAEGTIAWSGLLLELKPERRALAAMEILGTAAYHRMPTEHDFDRLRCQ